MRVALALFVLLAAVGCGATDSVETAASPPEGTAASADQRNAAIYSAVIRQILMKDNTFGSTPTPVKVVYVLNRPIVGAADPEAQVTSGSSQEAFSETLNRAVRARLVELPPVKFVPTRNSVVVGDKAGSSPGHVRAGGVLITLGPIVGDEGKVRVANSWWMNGLSGQWLTYVLAQQEPGWEVTGIDGPIAIS
jgi:hypothetical protein